MTRLMRGAFVGILGLTLVAAACGGGPTGPSPSSATAVTNLFSGSLSVGGVVTYTPVIYEASTITLAVLSLTSGAVGAATPAVVGLAYGAPDDAGTCVHTNTVRVAPSLLTQLTVTSTAEAHCVDIFDVGGLPGDVTFAVRVTTTPVLYKAPAVVPAPGTETFSSNLLPLGSVSRTFTASQSGVVSVTLNSASPPATVLLGLALGIPRVDGTGCLAYTSLNTVAGAAPQITAQVDPGTYCFRVYDPGTLPNLVNFTTTVTHP
jgi:hypothetical protein